MTYELLTNENKEIAIKFFNERLTTDKLNYGERQAINIALAALNKEESIGSWIFDYQTYPLYAFKCSKCGRFVGVFANEDPTIDYPYCHCGARMKETIFKKG